MQGPAKSARSDAGRLDIAFINNMPDPAFESTERQFIALLEAASDNILIRLGLFALPDIPRSDAARRRLEGAYRDVSEIWNAHLDGIIVTGTEPRAPVLSEEPYWATLAKLVDWAEANAVVNRVAATKTECARFITILPENKESNEERLIIAAGGPSPPHVGAQDGR